MPDARATNESYYDDDLVVEAYTERVESGLFPRERRAVSGWFDRSGRVLDLGCGAGRTTSALERAGFDVVGMDVSRPMVRSARRFVEGRNLLVADAAGLPFRSESFQQVLFSYNGIDYVPPDDRSAVFEEVRRVLRPGGTFVFSSHNLLNRLIVDPREPSTLRDRVRFWLRNLREGLLGSPLKLDRDSLGTNVTYYGTPFGQRAELESHGFEDVEILPRSGPTSKYFGPWLYYVARLA